MFLFKYPTGEKPQTNPADGEFDYQAADEIFFAAQTIQNACGTQAMLSVLLNKDGDVEIGSQLRDFKDFTTGFPADVRAFVAGEPTRANPDHSFEAKRYQTLS